MFPYSPTENDQSGRILASGIVGSSETRANTMKQLGSDIGGALMGIAGTYADNKALQAKAQSYDKIGDILGSSMFSGNQVAMNALGELKKAKDPREKIMGYEALLSFAGPYSNFVMANRSAGIRENQQALTARGQDITINMPANRALAAAEADVARGRGTISRSSIGYNPAAIRRPGP